MTHGLRFFLICLFKALCGTLRMEKSTEMNESQKPLAKIFTKCFNVRILQVADPSWNTWALQWQLKVMSLMTKICY